MRIFRFIAATKAEHSIQIMCRVLEVSRSGFHAWAKREPSARAVVDWALSERIAEIHADSLKTYGSPRVHAELRLEDGVHVGRKRVERLMRRADLSGQVKRRRGKTTIRMQGVRTAPTSSSATLTRRRSTAYGRPTSRTSARGRGGCTWRR